MRPKRHEVPRYPGTKIAAVWGVPSTIVRVPTRDEAGYSFTINGPRVRMPEWMTVFIDEMVAIHPERAESGHPDVEPVVRLKRWMLLFFRDDTNNIVEIEEPRGRTTEDKFQELCAYWPIRLGWVERGRNPDMAFAHYLQLTELGLVVMRNLTR